jgi:hypothetical protein
MLAIAIKGYFSLGAIRLEAGKSPGRADNPFIAGARGFAVGIGRQRRLGNRRGREYSEHGADKLMRSVRVKLGVVNRTQAVAEAIRRG